MRKLQPKLNLYLAERALFHYYSKNTYSAEQKLNIIHYCKEKMTETNLVKFLLRIMKEQNNDKIIACILHEASEEERIFLQDKYKMNMSYVSIGMKLYVHPNCLSRWRDKFLEEIAAMLLFQLPREDVFSILKIETMINVLDNNLEFWKNEGKSIADLQIVQVLADRRKRYNEIRNIYKHVLSYEISELTLMEKILHEKLVNKSASVDELSKISGLSTGTISGKLSAFSKKYIE